MSSDAKKDAKKETKAQATTYKAKDLSRIIIKPRITEKAAVVSEHNVYTFEVARDATKYDVRDAVKELFKVTPVRVNIVNRAPRQFMSRRRNQKSVHPGMKKAYIYLKKDDHIDLV